MFNVDLDDCEEIIRDIENSEVQEIMIDCDMSSDDAFGMQQAMMLQEEAKEFFELSLCVR